MLSDIHCKNAKANSKPYKIFDTAGLYLEIYPNGKKLWRIKYYFHGRERRLSLGGYPIVSLSEARDARDNIKKEILNNLDPALKRKKEKQLAKYKANQTVKLLSLEWHEKNKNKWSKSHADNILFRLENDINPEIGSYPAHELTPSILLTCLEKIEKRSPDQAKRALSIVGQFLRYGVTTERVPRDFTPDLRGSLKRIFRKHFAAFDYTELPDFLKNLKSNAARLFRRTILAILMLLLTFVRTRELIEAKKEEFDLDKSVWVIPAERMKMRIEHIVPLSKQVKEIVIELMNMPPRSEYLFPHVSDPQKPMSNNTILSALGRMGYEKKMTGHGFRSLAMSTIKEKLKYPHDVIDRQLSHLPRSMVDRAYDRATYLPDRTKMMQEWADYIDSLV